MHGTSVFKLGFISYSLGLVFFARLARTHNEPQKKNHTRNQRHGDHVHYGRRVVSAVILKVTLYSSITYLLELSREIIRVVAMEGNLTETAEKLPQEPAPQEETAESAAAIPTYSTRGRASDDPLERLAREAEERSSHQGTSSHPSFLSDSLTEEERRTRTRYIPDVEGMHALRKQQVKNDLQLARAAIEEDRPTALTLTFGNNDLNIPSPAFIAPEEVIPKPSPRHVEAVSAFNPPRPPESIGSKKKHRMKRWQERPAEIEIDLNKYRLTVQRTREELKKLVLEKERIQTVDGHFRRHYWNHLNCLDDEIALLTAELATVQQDCVQAADLLTSRTRSRGAGKFVMRDVLAVLKARGIVMQQQGVGFDDLPMNDPRPKGAGGVGILSFQDWNRNTEIEQGQFAKAWILPGERVESPYGPGEVLAVFTWSKLDPDEPPHEALLMGDSDAVMTEAQQKQRNEDGPLCLLAPRVAVKLPFGVGFFPLHAVELEEDPVAHFGDERLLKRWKGILETAKMTSGILDLEAMASVLAKKDDGSDAMVDEDENENPVLAEIQERHSRLLPFGSGLLPTACGRGGNLHKEDIAKLDKSVENMLYNGDGVLGDPNNPGVPESIRELEGARQENIHLSAKVLALKHKLVRQKRVRLLNERTDASNTIRAARVEALVNEMRADLKSLKNRLDDEIRELGIDKERAERILAEYFESLDTIYEGEASPAKRPRREKPSGEDLDEEFAHA